MCVFKSQQESCCSNAVVCQHASQVSSHQLCGQSNSIHSFGCSQNKISAGLLSQPWFIPSSFIKKKEFICHLKAMQCWDLGAKSNCRYVLLHLGLSRHRHSFRQGISKPFRLFQVVSFCLRGKSTIQYWQKSSKHDFIHKFWKMDWNYVQCNITTKWWEIVVQ